MTDENFHKTTGKFVWISDVHLDLFYGTEQANGYVAGADCEKPSTKSRYPYGRVACDSPQKLVDEVIRKAQSVISHPDFIVLTGDSCRHGNDKFPRPRDVLNQTLAKVTQSFEEIYTYTDDVSAGAQPNVVFPTIGNNDVTPDYYLDVDDPTGALGLILGTWKPWITDPSEQDTMMTGGYWSRDISDTLTIISLNTIVYSVNHDPQQNKIEDPLGQFAWLDQTLQGIDDENRKLPASTPKRHVIIIGHVPPTVGSYHHGNNWHKRYVDRYWETIKYYRDLVGSQLYGHLHSDEFRVVPPSSSRDGSMSHSQSPMALLMASSVTPIYGSNPSFRVVEYDKETGVIVDYDTHYIDLEDPDMDNLNTMDGPKWKQLEPFSQAFDVNDLSGANLQRIVTDVAYFETVAQTVIQRRHVQTRQQREAAAECDKECRLEWACTLQSFSKKEYNTCVKTDGSGKFTFKNINKTTPMWLKTFFLAIGIGVGGLIAMLWIVDVCRKIRNRLTYHVPDDVDAELSMQQDEDKDGGHDEDDAERVFHDGGNTTHAHFFPSKSTSKEELKHDEAGLRVHRFPLLAFLLHNHMKLRMTSSVEQEFGFARQEDSCDHNMIRPKKITISQSWFIIRNNDTRRNSRQNQINTFLVNNQPQTLRERNNVSKFDDMNKIDEIGNKKQVYLAFDERMGLHRPPVTTDDPKHPGFVYERPARIFAIQARLHSLEHRLVKAEFEKLKGLDEDGNEVPPSSYCVPCCLQANGSPFQRLLPVPCKEATQETVCLAHSVDYYRRMSELPNISDRDLKRLNALDDDLYYCRDTFLAASLAVGGCVACVDAVTAPNTKTNCGIAVVRPPGHHAEKSHSMGFCFFNNVAIAAKHAIATGRANRVFILDWDIHHGNGIQNLTYDDPDIFYLSIHRGPGGIGCEEADGGGTKDKKKKKKPRHRVEDPQSYFYPGTGRFDETGSNEGVGSNLNISWGRQGMGNVEYAAAFAEVVLPVMQDFSPDLILVACGLDAAAGDLLGDCGLTPEMYYIMTSSLMQTTGHTVPIVAILEGGYQLDVISDCMEAVALAFMDEPWEGNKITEPDVERSLSRYWHHQLMETKSNARAAAAQTSSQSASAAALFHAVSTIKQAAKALAFSKSPLGAYNCIQSPNGFVCLHCTGNCKKRRLNLMDSDQYPMKKQILVRSSANRKHDSGC
eukprot:CAMPEP_0119546890 /NCGR_PEP_ID=MMETSP1352-20130426/1129_1 /TAXON_ID=265584 /ORGANISM="Stauroneis constricta, Strain CCMP1120" /LENGTH=1185 /DNA_ID=CAMNT_0007591643 /DNA_START=262 /DNA_END=3822 /DNA_ORIENTATION=-